jgi:hypothetical protein
MPDISVLFTVIGIYATIYFIDKILTERKMNKLADETSRNLREERGRQQLGGGVVKHDDSRKQAGGAIGRWLVFDTSTGAEPPAVVVNP